MSASAYWNYIIKALYNMKIRVFHDEEATKYGLKEAILLNSIRYWQEHNQANNKNFHDGRYWVYNSVKAWAEMYGYFSESQIKRTLKSLEDQGLMISGRFNKSSYDRTKWFSLNEHFHLPNLSNGKDISVQPIPREYQEITKENTLKVSAFPFEDFWDLYDKKNGRTNSEKKYNKLSEATRQQIFNHIPRYKLEQPNKKYRKHPETYLNAEAWTDEIIIDALSAKQISDAEYLADYEKRMGHLPK